MSRTVLVTGGGTGIGLAIARRFAEAGDLVIITGRRAEVLKRAVEQLGESAEAITWDATDPGQASQALAGLPGHIDVLVNNAGGNTDLDLPPAGDLTGFAARWRANLDANLLSTVLTTEAVGDRLATGGTVLHLGSIAAERAGSGSYGAAKAALAAWNVDLADRLGARGITANVLSCGYIADTEFFRDRMSQQRRQTLIGQTLTRRAGVPADVAETAYFLASPGARHITAQVVNINGGAFPTR